jgi:hypothetical protein
MDDQSIAQTAPGSVGVNPVPDVVDHLPEPQPSVKHRTTLVGHGGEKDTTAPRTGPWAKPGGTDRGHWGLP